MSEPALSGVEGHARRPLGSSGVSGLQARNHPSALWEPRPRGDARRPLPVLQAGPLHPRQPSPFCRPALSEVEGAGSEPVLSLPKDAPPLPRSVPVASAAWLPVGPACPVRQDTGPVWAAEASLHNTSHPPARPATPICHSDRSPANQDRAEESRLPPPADPPTLRTTAPYAPVPSRVGQGARPARVSPAQSISSTMRHRRLPRVDLPPPLTPLGWCGRMGGTQAGQPARKGRSGPRILCVHTLHG